MRKSAVFMSFLSCTTILTPSLMTWITRAVKIDVTANEREEDAYTTGITFRHESCPLDCFRYWANMDVGNGQTGSRKCTTFTRITCKEWKEMDFNVCTRNVVKVSFEKVPVVGPLKCRSRWKHRPRKLWEKEYDGSYAAYRPYFLKCK